MDSGRPGPNADGAKTKHGSYSAEALQLKRAIVALQRNPERRVRSCRSPHTCSLVYSRILSTSSCVSRSFVRS
jgi:hypothetical protein